MKPTLFAFFLCCIVQVTSYGQLKLMQDVCPGPYDGVTHIANLNGQIITYGNQNLQWQKCFLRYNSPQSIPDSLYLEGYNRRYHISDMFTNEQDMLFIDDYEPVLNQTIQHEATKQVYFRTYTGDQFSFRSTFDSIIPVNACDTNACISYVASGAFHPISQDLYFLGAQHTNGDPSNFHGIVRKDYETGEETLLLNLMPHTPQGYLSGAIHQIILTEQYILFHFSYPINGPELQAKTLYSYHLETGTITPLISNFEADYATYSAMVNGNYAYLISDDGSIYRFSDETGQVEQIIWEGGSAAMNGIEHAIYPLHDDGALILTKVNDVIGLYAAMPDQEDLQFVLPLTNSTFVRAECKRFKEKYYIIVQYSSFLFELFEVDKNWNAKSILTNAHFEIQGQAYGLHTGKDYLFFEIWHEDVHELAFSDGTAAGTDLVTREGYFFHTTAFQKVSIDNLLYVQAGDIFYGKELFWVDENDLKVIDEKYKNPANIFAYPNPAEDQTSVQWSMDKDYSSLRLYTLTGQLVAEYTTTPNAHSINILMGGLQRGVYLVELFGETKEHIRLVKH
ncbi:MAG: Secretion system C-terminal sorting domain [Bacteroidota bacterium]